MITTVQPMDVHEVTSQFGPIVKHMRLPLHAIRVLSDGPRTVGTFLPNALEKPLVLREEVLDTVGLPCGFDLVVQDGFYLLLALIAAWHLARSRFRA